MSLQNQVVPNRDPQPSSVESQTNPLNSQTGLSFDPAEYRDSQRTAPVTTPSTSAYVSPTSGMPLVQPGSLSPETSPTQPAYSYNQIYVNPNEVIDLRTLGRGGDIPFSVAATMQPTSVGESLANSAQAHMNSGRVSWGRCAAWVNELIRDTPGATVVNYQGNYVYNNYPGAIDFARSISQHPGYVEVTPPPGQQFLTAQQIRDLPDGTIVAYQRVGNTVNREYTSANYYGHIGVLRSGTVVSDGYVRGDINVYGTDENLTGARAFIPIPTNRETLAAARPIPRFSAQQVDQMNADLAAGKVPLPQPDSRGQLIEANQNQLRWAQEQLKERFGENPAAQQVLSQLREVPTNGVYDQPTQQAIASFRQAFGLSPEGGMDAEYRNLLNALIVGPLNHSQPNRFPTTQTALTFANQWEQAALTTPQAPPTIAIGTTPSAPSPSSTASSAQTVDTEQVHTQLSSEQQAVLQQIVSGELKVGWLEDSRGQHVQVIRDLMVERANSLGISGFTSYRSDIFGSRDNELLSTLRTRAGIPNSPTLLTPEDVKALFGYP